MIDCWRILDALRDYYSPEENDDELTRLCEAAAKELETRLKKDADETDIRLINAAAASVNYRLGSKKLASSEGETSFKAGDVTVKTSLRALVERAEKDRDEAMTAALPLLKDDGFFFRGTAV